MIFDILTKGKCKMCYAKKKPNEEFSILRMQVQEGLIELEICEPCAEFFDKSAEVLRNKNGKDESI
jgi:hypothetical protein